MSSSDYLNIKNKYVNVKDKVKNAIDYFDGCSDCIRTTSSYLESLIINGKTFDDGKLNEDNAKLSTAKSNLQSIVNECNNKIDEYDRLYNEALARERAAINKRNNESELGNVSSEKTINSNEDIRTIIRMGLK